MLKLPWQVVAEVRRGALSRARMADVADRADPARYQVAGAAGAGLPVDADWLGLRSPGGAITVVPASATF
jgi:hypothetical protein